MLKLTASLLIAVVVVANAVAHLSVATAYAAPASGTPAVAVATSPTDMSSAQAIGLPKPVQALQSGYVGCTQSFTSLTCPVSAAQPQHHPLPPAKPSRSLFAVTEAPTRAGLGPFRLFRPPILFS